MSEARQAWEALEEDIRQRLLSEPEGGHEAVDLYRAEDCPRCLSYDCAGVARPPCAHMVTLFALCQMGEHSFCDKWWCDFGYVTHQIVEKGLPHATRERPLVVVAVDETAPDELAVRGTYARHQQAKPARTRAAAQYRDPTGWAHKAYAFVVCGRCEQLHGT